MPLWSVSRCVTASLVEDAKRSVGRQLEGVRVTLSASPPHRSVHRINSNTPLTGIEHVTELEQLRVVCSVRLVGPGSRSGGGCAVEADAEH
jgi:hypothetical protein